MIKGSSPDPDGETDRGTQKKKKLRDAGTITATRETGSIFLCRYFNATNIFCPRIRSISANRSGGALERAAASYLISELFNRSTGPFLLCILFTYIVCSHVVKGLSSATGDFTSQLSLFGDHLDGTLDRLCTQKLFSHA